jgi:hypothetical protein
MRINGSWISLDLPTNRGLFSVLTYPPGNTMTPKRFLPLAAIPLLLASVSCTPPTALVYSAGFSFSRYDFLVFGKSLPGQTTALYGMDLEIANMMARYNMKIVGDKEYEKLSPDDKTRTLIVRGGISTYNNKSNLITISFDDAVSGKTVANLTAQAKGDLYNPKYRTKALELVSKPLAEALSREKGLKIINEKVK